MSQVFNMIFWGVGALGMLVWLATMLIMFRQAIKSSKHSQATEAERMKWYQSLSAPLPPVEPTAAWYEAMKGQTAPSVDKGFYEGQTDMIDAGQTHTGTLRHKPTKPLILRPEDLLVAMDTDTFKPEIKLNGVDTPPEVIE